MLYQKCKINPKGNEFIGLCPFHNEKHLHLLFLMKRVLSLLWMPGAWRSFNFIMETQGISFQDTVIMLANDLGIDISRENSSYNQK